MKEDEIGATCGTHGTAVIMQGFGGENLEGRNYLVDISADGRIILKRIVKK
jgi:hypothetical protein